MSYEFSDKLPKFKDHLVKVWKHFNELAKERGIACFRFYDHDLPEFPFVIEFYNGVVHAAEYKRRHGMDDVEHEAWLQACKHVLCEVLEVQPEVIYMKQRMRKAGKQGQYQKFGESKVEQIVPEAGLSFIINLTDYLDTGLFLDHRTTRSMVMEEAKGKHVLNLFCYTGSFSLYAAKGGAASVTSVDMSKIYLNWAKRNMQFNKLYDDKKHEFIQSDVQEWLRTIQSDIYDLIICDPPTFSNSKRMGDDFDVQRDHVWLLTKLLKGCTPGGTIYFSNYYPNFVMDGENVKASHISDITASTTPFDFEGRLTRSCFLLEK